MAPMAETPTGFALHEHDGARCVLRDDCAAALLAAGVAEPESWRDRATRVLGGRGPTFAVAVPDVGSVCVRPYRHGGALRHVTGDRYAGDTRFAGELALTVALAAEGVPVPEVLGYVSQAAGLGFRRGWLLTFEQVGASDVIEFLRSAPRPTSRRATLRTAGRSARRLHDAGVVHPDLHLANLLRVSDDRVLVLDLDAAQRVPDLDRDQRLDGLFRLDRHAEKQRSQGHPISRTDRLRVLRAYAGDDWPDRDEVRRLAARLRRHVARHRVPVGEGR